MWANQEFNIYHGFDYYKSDQLVVVVSIRVDSVSPKWITGGIYGYSYTAGDNRNIIIRTSASGFEGLHPVTGERFTLANYADGDMKVSIYAPEVFSSVKEATKGGGVVKTYINIPDSTDKRVVLPDAGSTEEEHVYIRSGNGSGRLFFDAAIGQQIGGKDSYKYEIEGQGILSVLPRKKEDPFISQWDLRQFSDFKQYVVGYAGAPTFLSTWKRSSQGGYVVITLKDNKIYLSGCVYNGSSHSTIFKLPTKYKPQFRLMFSCGTAGDKLVNIQIDTQGNVSSKYGVDSYTHIFFDGISWDLNLNQNYGR